MRCFDSSKGLAFVDLSFHLVFRPMQKTVETSLVALLSWRNQNVHKPAAASVKRRRWTSPTISILFMPLRPFSRQEVDLFFKGWRGGDPRAED